MTALAPHTSAPCAAAAPALARTALITGTAGTAGITLGSYGAGAIQYQDSLLQHLGLSALTYGHGAGLLGALYWVGLIALVAAWVMLGRALVLNRSGDAVSGEDRRLLTTIIAWAIPLVFAAPIQSRDVYSYLMQGALTRDGFDAYSQGAVVDPGAYLGEVSHDWRTTTTPYGPAHLWIGKIITTLVGDNVTAGVIAYKLLAVVGFITIAFTTRALARQLGGSTHLALWLGVANPLVLTHLLGGLHNEALMVGISGIAVLLAARGRILSGVAVLAAAVAIKATAIIILPFMAWQAVDQWQARSRRATTRAPLIVRLAYGVLAGVVLGVVLIIVLAAITALTGTSWGWVGEITGNGKVINPLAAPSFIAGVITGIGRLVNEHYSYNSTLAITRAVSSVIMLVGLAACWIHFRTGLRRTIGGMASAFGVATIFNSVALPWYYISPLALVGTVSPPRWVVRAVVWASIVVGLSFTPSGNHKLYDVPWIFPLLVVAWLAARWLIPTTPAQAHSRPGAADADSPGAQQTT